MTKTFCDVCGGELERNYVRDRLRVWDGLIVADVTVGKKDKTGLSWNKGDICRPCLIKVITNGLDLDTTGGPKECT